MPHAYNSTEKMNTGETQLDSVEMVTLSNFVTTEANLTLLVRRAPLKVFTKRKKSRRSEDTYNASKPSKEC